MSQGSGAKWIFWIVLGSLLLSSDDGHARQDTVPGSRYISARGSALGDAFLPLADDGAGALFYNPAALGRLRQTQFEPLNFGLEVNNDYTTMFDLNFTKAIGLPGYQESLSNNPGKFPGVGGHYFPNFFSKGFAFGVLINTKMAASRNGDAISYRALYQLIPTAGFGFNLARGIIRIGYSAQLVSKTVSRTTVPSTSPSIGYTHFAREGMGLSHNVGFAVTLPFRFLPAFNFVGRNIGGVKYKSSSLFPVAEGSTLLGTPDNEEMSIDGSFSIQPKFGGKSYVNLVAQYRDMTNRSQTSILMRVAGSVELSVRDSFFLRLGYGSAYPSAGLGLRSKTAEFGLSWYSEELGLELRSIRDIRFLLQYQGRVF